MTKQEQYEIIQLVVIIFQNVGIKRCIDKIDILKNYQIYFEICKVIFPQTMIQLLRFSQGPQSNAQKIQGVIGIVGKILQNDLYHISGQAIAQGKLSHIRNFLHILQLLSQNVHKGNRNQEQVQSAPQNTRSLSDYDQQGHYTVIGIDKEFERQYQDEEWVVLGKDNKIPEEQKDTRREAKGKNRINNNNKNENDNTQNQEQESQSQGPMNPVLDDKRHISKKMFVKSKVTIPKQDHKISVLKLRPKPLSNTTYYQPKKLKVGVRSIPKLQEFLSKPTKKQQTRKRFKSEFMKNINNIIQDFQVKNLTDLKLQHNIWVRTHQNQVIQKQNQIEEESKQRIQFANQLINQRKKKISTLKNAKWAVNVMANLFQEQRSILKGMKKAKQQSEIYQIQAIVHSQVEDQHLLRQALMAGNPQNFNQRKK